MSIPNIETLPHIVPSPEKIATYVLPIPLVVLSDEQSAAVKKMISVCMKEDIPIPLEWVKGINAQMNDDS